jgi:hypothetical protein
VHHAVGVRPGEGIHHVPEDAHRLGKPGLKNLRLPAIDGISIGRGRRYLTVVLNLQSGPVVSAVPTG